MIFLHTTIIELRVDPVHFGIIMVMNLCIEICTFPVGTLLFVGIGIAGTTIEKIIKPLMPLSLAMLAVLLLVRSGKISASGCHDSLIWFRY